ncbi:hypothetical protein T229_10030 [Tannerella sp. oral taxon BU063 isolate Cell 5]|uniref:Uncharacterized protein n=1 Tax=Tannerella sp. oral taxon BU063 isolate Cell 5 TaxID=1410950 RepID=W2CCP2_9BACT|nr:hypothetical protein T229_10030 [Tannerella sp. oral taxon BU063 isolate Cell 5]
MNGNMPVYITTEVRAGLAMNRGAFTSDLIILVW